MDLPLPQDFKEFLRLLSSERIEYLIVGGYAVSVHGYPRPTGDLGVWVAMESATATRLVGALAKFGFTAAGATKELFLTPNRVVRMGEPPVRIEILTSISGVDFSACYARRVSTMLDGVSVEVIGLADLIANKTAAGRDRDRDDVARLRGIAR
ncbi:MAG TPA: nucleotidyltransferase [Gemmatimonadaceae bacterium]|nr:nucleotidyltransferase [Gemmatimonadaceae bacterium]